MGRSTTTKYWCDICKKDLTDRLGHGVYEGSITVNKNHWETCKDCAFKVLQYVTACAATKPRPK